MAGLNDSLDMTVDEGEVVVTLHDLLRGGARLQDGSKLTVQAYKVPSNHADSTNMMVEQHPNPRLAESKGHNERKGDVSACMIR